MRYFPWTACLSHAAQKLHNEILHNMNMKPFVIDFGLVDILLINVPMYHY